MRIILELESVEEDTKISSETVFEISKAAIRNIGINIDSESCFWKLISKTIHNEEELE